MGSIREFNPVKLFVGVLVSDPSLISSVEQELNNEYGPVDYRSPLIPFQFTTYYESEMGPNLTRAFFSFEQLIQADQLPAIKQKANTLEESLAPAHPSVKRPVNLDPGYIENAKIILASTKNFYHRIYLGQGIFAEVTMHFRKEGWQFFPWTYPDYQSPPYLEFFMKSRQIYRTQLKNLCILRQG